MKFLRILFLLFAFSFGATFFFLQESSVVSDDTGSMRIEIASGESVREIASTLKEQGIIRSALIFRLYLLSHGLDRSLKAGTFLIPDDASFAEIAELLSKSESGEAAVTIPEGYTIAQLDALLTKMDVMEEGELLRCAETCDFSSFTFLPVPSAQFLSGGRLEGYLFPDTYFIHPREFVPKLFLERLLSTFQERIVEGLATNITVSERSLHDLITMASLIERETSTDEERGVVSGILWKRFDSGRALDVDATIRYALGKITGALTREDLDVDSPYNTRKYPGLPPGPIANPGLKSIEAALHPKDSPYWFYLHGKDGQIRYSETNDEHNEKKARYL